MRFTTVENWAQYFEETEGTQFGITTIKRKLGEAGIIGKTGRNKIGRIMRNAFYSEVDVMNIFGAEIEANLSRADEMGFIDFGNKRYSTCKKWSEILNIAQTTIQIRLEKSGKKPLKGKDIHGVKRDFWCEDDIHIVCKDMLYVEFPQANKEGFFTLNHVKFGSINYWAQELLGNRARVKAIIQRLRNGNITGISGKDYLNHIWEDAYFCEADIEKTCSDLKRNCNEEIVCKDGFYIIDGVKYASLKKWTSEISVSRMTLKKLLEKANKVGRNIKLKNTGICICYSEEDVKEVCADFLQKLPLADEFGFIEIEGIKFGTAPAWGKKLSINSITINKYLKRHNIVGIVGRVKAGNICSFFCEPDVLSACADLLLVRQSSPETSEGGAKRESEKPNPKAA